jgi:transposase
MARYHAKVSDLDPAPRSAPAAKSNATRAKRRPRQARRAPGGGAGEGNARANLSNPGLVLQTGISWTHLPNELGFGSGVTCWRRLDEWQRAGVWERLHELLLARLRAAGEIEWSRAVADASHVQAKGGRRDGPEPG